MAGGLEGLGIFLGKLGIQFQGRIERLKNEKKRLEDEDDILREKQFSASGGRRRDAIAKRLREIDSILGNNAKD